MTTTAICGSDLHLYDTLGAFLSEGDILGHEPMGYVEEVGDHVHDLAAGDRVVVPFQIACGHCFMCDRGMQSQCETTQVTEQNMGARLFGYTKLYGSVPGGQAEYLRVPQAHYGPIRVPEGPPDDRFVLLSDVLPTAWQSVAYADVPPGGTVAVLGLGPIGDMACWLAPYHGADSVIDAVGMEAHGVASPMSRLVDSTLGSDLAGELNKAGSDSMGAFYLAADIALLARDAGSASGLGVYSVTWFALGLVHILTPPGQTSSALGLFLVAFTVMVAGIGGVGLLDKRLLGVILLLSAVRAALSAAYQLGVPAPVEPAQGGVALLIFAIAVYAGIAFLLEDMLQRTVLPVLRRSAARESFEGDLGEQLGRVDHEAGVRRQL